MGHVDELWYAKCAALAIERVTTMTSIRSTPIWAQSAELEAGQFRLTVVYDYRDDLVYLEIAGLPHLARAAAAFEERGFSASAREGIFLEGAGPTLATQVDRSGPWGHDLMYGVARILWLVDQIARHGHVPVGPIPDAEPLHGRSSWTLAGSARRAFRRWRTNPGPSVLRLATPYGPLIVDSRLDRDARWLARLVSSEPPPSDPSIGLRWTPSMTGTRPEQLALVWQSPASTVNGSRIPSLTELLDVIHG